MNLIRVWVHASWGLRTLHVLFTHALYLLWFLVVLYTHFFDYNHAILSSTTNLHFNKILQTTQQPKTLDRASSRPSCIYDGQFEQVMGERDILFVWHAFLFRFLSLWSHLLVWFFRHKNIKALQRTLGYYNGQLMYFVQVSLVIHVYKRCTLLNSYTEGLTRHQVWVGMHFVTLCIVMVG